MARTRNPPDPETNEAWQTPPAPTPPAPTPVDGAKQAAEGGPPADTSPEPSPPKGKKGYFVAAGKSITSLRDILTPGEEVFPADFLDGQTDLDVLVKNGHVVKKS